MERQPCVYILASSKYGRLYIGVTSDLMKRLSEHRYGLVEDHSKKYNIKRLVRFELFTTMDLAIAREKQLKNWHREWKTNLIDSDNPSWVDLAVAMGFEPI